VIGRNFIAKYVENFSECNAKISPEISLPLPRNRQKTEMISLSYDVNDRPCLLKVEIHLTSCGFSQYRS